MAVQHDINQQAPKSGRMIRENNSLINEADLLFYGNGLPYSVARNEAGVLSADVVVEPGDFVALNIYLDKESVISNLDITGIEDTIVRAGHATGTYGEIGSSVGLKLTEVFSDNSQYQVVSHAEPAGDVLADGFVGNSIIADSSTPISVIGFNRTNATVSASIYLTFFRIGNASGLTLLQPDTLLASDTEMSDYGPN